MSDRIIVMWGGEIAQEGRPGEIYRNPKSRFVADFIGRSNLIPYSSWKTTGRGTEVMLADSGISLVSAAKKVTPETGFVCIRPEHLHLSTAAEIGPNRLTGRLTRVVDLGAQLELSVELADDLLITLVCSAAQGLALPAPGGEFWLSVAPEDVRLLSS